MIFFKNKYKQVVESAHNTARLAHKVICYRKDILEPAVVESIEAKQEALLQACDQRAEQSVIEAKTQQLHAVIAPHGGDIYPVSFWGENVEMILVAGILAIGIRTFFFQPFKIPTNSMYPTYNGMTCEVYHKPEERPTGLSALFRKITLFTSKKQLVAESSGQVYLVVRRNSAAQGVFAEFYEYPVNIPLQKGNLLPAIFKDYYFFLNDQFYTLTLPADFGFNDMLNKDYAEYFRAALGHPIETDKGFAIPFKTVQQGERIIDFDVLTGDMLFVDRLTYHFRKPRVGEPFVFRTNQIEGLMDPDGNDDEKYYIKRLVGQSGDVLEVREPALYRNGQPIEGAEAFQKNADLIGEYEGYQARGWLRDGATETILDGYFYAMGDNSDLSFDSRLWAYDSQIRPTDSSGLRPSKQIVVNQEKKMGKPVNFVPEKDVVGRAIFIFYPFTHRWGVAE